MRTTLPGMAVRAIFSAMVDHINPPDVVVGILTNDIIYHLYAAQLQQ